MARYPDNALGWVLPFLLIAAAIIGCLLAVNRHAANYSAASAQLHVTHSVASPDSWVPSG